MASSASLLVCFLAALFCTLSGAAHLAPLDAAVLNFALNLEYLEANFYGCAAYGRFIPEELWMGGENQSGEAPIGCPARPTRLSKQALAYAIDIYEDELAHVKFLKAVLGSAAVPQPLMDLGPAFKAAGNAAASLALGENVTLDPVFNPYANDLFFYHGAFIFEDVGATAYAGAASLINDTGILTAAAQILAVEGYHAGAIRTLLFQSQGKKAINKPKLLVRDVVQAISDLRDFVDGPADMDSGVTVASQCKNEKPGSNIVPTDENGLIYTRTTDQVLAIVYLGGAPGKGGGFFPNGMNGQIN
eukprot:gene27459-4764_t